MKKTVLMTLIVLVGVVSAVNTGYAKDGKKKAKKAFWEVVPADTATLTSPADTISYASGMAVSDGLIGYLQKTCDFDTLFINDFKQGFYEAIDRGNDPKYIAYNAGIQIGSQVQRQIYPHEVQDLKDLTDTLYVNQFYKGFMDGVDNDTTVFKTKAAIDFVKQRKDDFIKQQNDAYNAENVAFLEENKTKEGVITLPSGLQYKVITEGEGAVATENDNVTVRYEGKMIDGTVFDSSYDRDPDTSTFKPSKVIKGWTEALCMMPEGSKWELYIPQELGYGERPAGKIKPYSTLIFTVEVVKVN